MTHPLKRCALSLCKGDDSLAAGLPLLAVPGLGVCLFQRWWVTGGGVEVLHGR